MSSKLKERQFTSSADGCADAPDVGPLVMTVPPVALLLLIIADWLLLLPTKNGYQYVRHGQYYLSGYATAPIKLEYQTTRYEKELFTITIRNLTQMVRVRD